MGEITKDISVTIRVSGKFCADSFRHTNECAFFDSEWQTCALFSHTLETEEYDPDEIDSGGYYRCQKCLETFGTD